MTLFRLTLTLFVSLVPAAGATPTSEDPRSQVVLEQICSNDFTRRELTLFANGTLRQRDGEGATRTMRLAELGQVEYDAYLRRFAEIRFEDLAPASSGLEGEWVETCRLELELPGAELQAFDYGRFDSVPHGLRLVLLVVDDLLLEIERRGPGGAARERELDLEVGDRLVRRRDGALFEVLGFTMEGTGVELQGIDQPVTVIMLEDQVQLEFDAAEEDPPL